MTKIRQFGFLKIIKKKLMSTKSILHIIAKHAKNLEHMRELQVMPIENILYSQIA